MAGELVLLSRLAEIAKARGALLKVDQVRFRVTLPTSGSITQPSSVKVRSNYDYYMFELRAGHTPNGTGGTTSDAAAQDPDEISFNLSESGTGENMFNSDVELSTLVNGQNGNLTPMSFQPFGYKISAGADVSCTVNQRTNVTLARTLVVMCVCVLAPVELKSALVG